MHNLPATQLPPIQLNPFEARRGPDQEVRSPEALGSSAICILRVWEALGSSTARISCVWEALGG